MSKRSVIVAICAVLVFAFAATQAPSKKHKHGVKMVYTQAQVSTPAFSFASGTAFCPPGTAATGGGEEWVGGLATVDMGFVGTNAYYVLVDNSGNSTPSVMNVQVACTAGTSKANGRPLSRAQALAQVDQMVAEREAAHRAAESNR